MKTKLFRLKFEGALASGIRALDAARTTSVGAAALFAGILPGPVAAGPTFELVGSYAHRPDRPDLGRGRGRQG